MNTEDLKTYISLTMGSITFIWYLVKVIIAWLSPKYNTDQLQDEICHLFLIPFTIFLLGWFIALITVIVGPVIVALNAVQLISKYKSYVGRI